MRTKRAILNNLAAGLLQLTILLFSLIVPRLMIGTYGSQLNGLVSSTKQMVSYLYFLELGISSALIFTLFQPLANKNYNQINPFVTRGVKEYNKISLFYFIGVILLSLVYPLLIIEKLNYAYIFLIVFIIGVYGAIEFFTFTKYKILLQADQKGYVLDTITIVTTILQNITSIMLMLFNKSILLVVFVPIIYLPIRSLFLRIYIKKKYPLVDYSVKPSEEKLESRKDAFLSGVSNSLSVSLPIIMVSFLISLEMASVFSIYSMVFMGLTAIISVFRSGMGAVFGNVYAKNEMDIFRESNDSFEFLMYALIAVLYSVALSLITPFIKVYVSDVADINYIYPMVGVLFTIWSIAHNSKTPGEIIIDSTGKWKLARKTYIIQTLMLVLGVFTLGYFFGINGFLIGMIIASLYKSVSIIFIVNSKILKQTSKKTILRFLRMFLIVFMVNIPFIFNLINIEVSGFSEWFFVAIIVFLWGIIITTIINFLFDFETTKRLYHRYIKGFLRKSK